MNRPYSEATVELAVKAIVEANWTAKTPGSLTAEARAVLDALAEAGLLLPEGVETRTEWGIRNGFGVHDYRNREQAEMWLDISGSTAGELVRRTVSASPWEPSGDDVRPDEASRT